MNAMRVGQPPDSDESGVRETRWYVFLHDSGRANEIVAKALNTEADNAERFRQDVTCGDGRERNLISVSFAEARIARNAGTENDFKVTVFVEEGGGAPREWKDPSRTRRRKLLLKKVAPAAR
jgi:hypothetical protein